MQEWLIMWKLKHPLIQRVREVILLSSLLIWGPRKLQMYVKEMENMTAVSSTNTSFRRTIVQGKHDTSVSHLHCLSFQFLFRYLQIKSKLLSGHSVYEFCKIYKNTDYFNWCKGNKNQDTWLAHPIQWKDSRWKQPYLVIKCIVTTDETITPKRPKVFEVKFGLREI